MLNDGTHYKEWFKRDEMTNGWQWKVSYGFDYAGENDTRTSVAGFIVYWNVAVMLWRLCIQKSVTLSSAEA